MIRSITTNELFHYTKFENLIGIIENGFYPRFKLEYTYLSDIFPERPDAFSPIPMVCFCDIPLYLVEEHSNKYGKCAIGLTKKWGNKYGLKPVSYLPPNSQLGAAHAALSNSFNNYPHSRINNMETVNLVHQVLKSSTNLSCFLKQYERIDDVKISLNGKIYLFPKGRFYDEREWRFVPFDREHGSLIVIPPTDLEDEHKLEKINANLNEYKLNFAFSDITNLIYETEEQKKIILKTLIKRFNCSVDEITNRIDIRPIESCTL